MRASRWTAFGAYLAAIYAFLPFGRGVILALQQRHVLGVTVTLVYFVSVVAVVYHVVFNVRLSDRVAFAALVLLALATGAMVLGLAIPEERVHFLEYGILALLGRWALERNRGPATGLVGAWLLATLAGWGDELIQRALPDRVYDLRDVAVNSAAALLALAADEALHNRLGWRPQGASDETGPDRRR